ncbi:MAG: helix-turn-helix domain-containing protein [Alphaproteobacteria bacterium]|nr:AraC family transcriptional regulator [Rhizobiaceae bacterium]MBU3963235.1 helix-turn-helix domain-containing protein [Alphaproteobacteria bacterium]MBU4048837.1 helix-turn-helix domain-containing protein [Alphaproteobacteria bacterium]MBU4088249.1 helix-turn-helix domain-containing protein [Alphaproteobacteria bacterium]MBU4158810.1 helix-turn-helix domain-containing protein [Alphaproteobacteria bacterium]
MLGEHRPGGRRGLHSPSELQSCSYSAPPVTRPAETAYRWGFSDQAQFGRHYRARYGCTPRETKARSVP